MTKFARQLTTVNNAGADFDDDGDLDLVVNNINENVLFFENNSDKLSDKNYLQFQLKGPKYNASGIGAKVIMKHDGETYYLEQMPVRGFLSSVSQIMHVGLGNFRQIDSTYVIWPGGTFQLLKNTLSNQKLTLDIKDASGNFYTDTNDANRKPDHPFFKLIVDEDLDYQHIENTYHDIHREYLIPRLISTEGPGMAIGDVNNDGLDDIFFTNAQGNPAKMLFQKYDGTFVSQNKEVFLRDSIFEGVDARFLDVDVDGDKDLIVVSAGNDYREGHDHLADRLYLNDGSGSFNKKEGALPQNHFNGSCIASADYDRDGDIDIFIGGRVIAGDYGISPKSYLLENDGLGIFSETEIPQNLQRVGMVTDATWADIDGNGWEDLIVVGEWMSVSIFLNTNGEMSLTTDLVPQNTSGWWNCVMADDLDNDGDIDLLLGNLGLNSKLKASLEQPVRLYLKDFDENGSTDPILTFTYQGKEYPFATKDVLSKQITSLKKKFPDYASFSGATIDKILDPDQIRDAIVREVHGFESMYYENEGEGKFITHPLPLEANFSPIMSMETIDFDKDGLKDIICAGNFHAFTPGLGQQDASYGILLHNRGNGKFHPINNIQSGINISGQVREIQWLKSLNNMHKLVIARNNESPLILSQNNLK